KCTKEYQKAICLQYQAQMLRLLGRLEEAHHGFIQALNAFQLISRDHFDIARILREQALILWEKDERATALKKVKEALRMQKRVYGDIYTSQPTVAATYRTLGDFLLEMGGYSKSDRAYQKAIMINQKAYQTKSHPRLAELYHQRARALRALGQKSRAEKMERKFQHIESFSEN
ncbi:MAG TPA: tetratricopeptide repeat protein, partial [Candidatus Babeliaceae bacterium]|nr:tetratricopeptide repeat protein [Candidatus Babeliaceae bacterium]